MFSLDCNVCDLDSINSTTPSHPLMESNGSSCQTRVLWLQWTFSRSSLFLEWLSNGYRILTDFSDILILHSLAAGFLSRKTAGFYARMPWPLRTGWVRNPVRWGSRLRLRHIPRGVRDVWSALVFDGLMRQRDSPISPLTFWHGTCLSTSIRIWIEGGCFLASMCEKMIRFHRFPESLYRQGLAGPLQNRLYFSSDGSIPESGEHADIGIFILFWCVNSLTEWTLRTHVGTCSFALRDQSIFAGVSRPCVLVRIVFRRASVTPHLYWELHNPDLHCFRWHIRSKLFPSDSIYSMTLPQILSRPAVLTMPSSST